MIITTAEINANINLFNEFNLAYRMLDVYCDKYKDSPYTKILLKLFEKEENGEFIIDNIWSVMHESNKLIHFAYAKQTGNDIAEKNLIKLDRIKDGTKEI